MAFDPPAGRFYRTLKSVIGHLELDRLPKVRAIIESPNGGETLGTQQVGLRLYKGFESFWNPFYLGLLLLRSITFRSVGAFHKRRNF
jgi:hypothetical protein